MKISFYLRNRRPGAAAILLRINHGEYIVRNGQKIYKPFEFRLPFKVNPTYWLSKKQRAKESYIYAEGVEINMYLDKLEGVIKSYISTSRFNGEALTDDGLRAVVLEVFGLDKGKKIRYFSDVIKRMIEESENGKRLSKDGSRIKPNTIRKYSSALRHLENYEREIGKVAIDKVNKSLAQNLQVYFNEINLSQNTKATQFNVYRTALNYAIEKGYTDDVSFKDITAPEVLTDAIALTEGEVDRIFQLQLNDPVLKIHRDIFIVGIWSMLRFSDYSRLEELHVVENGTMLKLYSSKTQRPVFVPLHWQLKEIIGRYDSRLPQLRYVQHFNRSLKKIGELAKISRATEVQEFKGGKMRKKIVPRYSLISSHTARRTGATLLYLAKIPKKQIMLLTDHTKEVNFDKYIRIDKYANAKSLSEHEIFKR